MSLCLILLTSAMTAQDKSMDFSGTWNLDKGKSELGRRSNIESMTLKVVQTETELTVEKSVKRDESLGRGGRNARRRRPQTSGTQPVMKYDLTGKETKGEGGFGRFGGEVKLKAKLAGDKLILTQNRSIDSPRGKFDMKTVETWKLSGNKKILIISTDRETPRGTRSFKMEFQKKIGDLKGFKLSSEPHSRTFSTENQSKSTNAKILNSGAISLPSPTYPKAAKMVGVKGTVNVEVFISKGGDVIAAKAISGHPLLRKSAVEAARKAKFKKTTFVEGNPVEVQGIIVYNFR